MEESLTLVQVQEIKSNYRYEHYFIIKLILWEHQWEAVKNLKEQTMLIVNQVAAAMPPESTGNDLNKVLLDVMMKQQKGQLHAIVLEALNYEARKLMK